MEQIVREKINMKLLFENKIYIKIGYFRSIKQYWASEEVHEN